VAGVDSSWGTDNVTVYLAGMDRYHNVRHGDQKGRKIDEGIRKKQELRKRKLEANVGLLSPPAFRSTFTKLENNTN